ncbi:deoxycytidylate deaminase-like [Achroia grisella]|uniref:deoxycytidylate deaminase-like n=1 Tax=Achroia grisella TaxID=688607 RepID=UPI0027D2BC45|nr:deoxycytidylate deaminase-like [Achroia grisella]
MSEDIIETLLRSDCDKYRVQGRVCLEEDEYFMGLASWEAKRSKDPHFQKGAIVVNDDDEIISRGYNCWAKGNNYPYNETVKKLIITHAVFNAILNAPGKVKDCRIYVTLFPCNECAKMIIQSGIKSVIFSSDENGDTYKASRRMLEDAGIDIRQQVSPPVYTESELAAQGNSDDEKTQQNDTCYEPPKKQMKSKVSNKK